MDQSRVFSQKGWRRAAAINVSLAYICTLVLLICLLISVSQKESSLILPTILFEGPCTTSSTLSLVLHLLVNIVSGAMLASSSFFMQVLSAPSRDEIDRAHAWLRSLDIGVPSVNNLWHMSWFKLISWFIFFCSSIPIHLFFNSAIFQTQYLRSKWHLTIATESFTQGAVFFPPGASLSAAGLPMPVEPWNEPWNKPWDGPYIENGTPVAYGYPVPVIDYWDPSSIARQNLSSVAREAHAWTVLNITECQAQYLSCTPRTTYGDVAVIVETGTLQSAGWTRSELFNFQASSNLSSYWDLLIPPGSINSLWFSAQCSTRRQLSGSGREDTCRNICLGALGSDLSFDPGSEDDTWAGFPVLDFSAQKFPPPQDPWFLNFHGAIGQHENSTLYKTHALTPSLILFASVIV